MADGISLEQLASLFGVGGDNLDALRSLLTGAMTAKPAFTPKAPESASSLAPPGAAAGPDLMTRAAVNLGAADTFDVRDRIAAALRNVIPTPDLGKREQILASQSVMPGVSDPSGWGPPRADVLRAREIFQAQGWDGLWAAAKKGLVPMAAIAAVIGYGGPQAVFPRSQNEPQ